MSQIYTDTLNQAINALERQQLKLLEYELKIGTMTYKRVLNTCLVSGKFEVEVYQSQNANWPKLEGQGISLNSEIFADLEQAVEYFLS